VIRVALACIAAAGLSGACADPGRASRGRPASAVHNVRADSARAGAARAANLEPGALRTVTRSPVEQWKGPGGRTFAVSTGAAERQSGHARRFGSITRPTALRTRPLDPNPCTSCHLGRNVVMADRRITDAHQNVRPEHPEQTGARCSTCHASDDVELLTLLSGRRATLDESYRLCAQCHFTQVEDWAAGAHGKRLDGWRGQRVLMICTDCHDPHRPAIAPEIPFRAPRVERIRRPDR
jgi:hypothetical protein